MPEHSYSGSGATRSPWMDGVQVPVLPPLDADLNVDVCVVGAGLSGMLVALELARMKKSVAVIDMRGIAGGETARTTAHLTCAIDDRFLEVERIRGLDTVRIAAEAHAKAIDHVEEIIAEYAIDCDFLRVDGRLFTALGDQVDLLREELAAAHRAGIDGVSYAERSAMEDFDTGPHLLFPRQAQFHPLKFLAGVAEALQAAGVGLYGNTRATRIEGQGPLRVRTDRSFHIDAGAVVLATNMPIHPPAAIYGRAAPYRTYAIAGIVPEGSVPMGLYWDTGDPYHYVRLQPWEKRSRLLIVGGEDHKTGQASDMAERFEHLEQWTHERFPHWEGSSYRWSGQVLETPDGLAFIGRMPGDVRPLFTVTGDSGMGMTHASIASMLLPALIDGQKHAWAPAFDPSRFSIKETPGLIRENLNVSRHLAGDWIRAEELTDPDQLAAGEGALMRKGTHKIALYRDDGGRLHACSATCTHLGCVVQWNKGESSWDCPCHGSRFDATGRVLSGPADKDLPRVSLEEVGASLTVETHLAKSK